MTGRAKWNEPLVRSARKWIAEALAGWANSDYAKVVMLAPVAVEHLGKAALWHRNPVLLAPLEKVHLDTFVRLATEPNLGDSTLRTIGLTDVLSRLTAVYGTALPISTPRKIRLIESRGGAMHLGQHAPETARYVLTDALTLFQWLAGLMEINPDVLFGIHSSVAKNLLDERRSEKQPEVDQRIASAKDRFRKLADSVGDLLHDIIVQKEELTSSVLPRLIKTVSISSKHRCPACHQQGAMLGELETDPFVDVDSGPDGDVYGVDYEFYLIPDAFYCNVCNLMLNDPEELQFAALPHEKYLLPPDEVTDELIEYARDQDAWLAEVDSDGHD